MSLNEGRSLLRGSLTFFCVVFFLQMYRILYTNESLEQSWSLVLIFFHGRFWCFANMHCFKNFTWEESKTGSVGHSHLTSGVLLEYNQDVSFEFGCSVGTSGNCHLTLGFLLEHNQ